MNVAIVLMKYNPFGGYERQAALLAEALAARGDRVTVFTGEWKGPGREGITVEKVPVVRLASWLKVLSFAFFSRRRILRAADGFDVVVAFDRTLVADVYRAGNACHREWQAFRRAHEGFGGRLSMAINPLHSVINHIEKRLFSAIARGRGSIVVLSEAGMRQIRRHYDVDPDRFVVIPPAVDFSRFDDGGGGDVARLRAELGAGAETIVVLHVGSGFKIKGLRSTIEATAVLKARGVDALLVVAGRDTRATARLKRLASDLGIGDRVRFLGGVSDVARLYEAADVFCVPSLFETFGVAAVEALYAGLPVIVGSGAGVARTIEEWGAGGGEVAGTVVDAPAPPEPLAEAIERAFRGEGELRARGELEDRKRGRRALASRCGQDVVMERFLSLIDEMAERAGSKAS